MLRGTPAAVAHRQAMTSENDGLKNLAEKARTAATCTPKEDCKFSAKNFCATAAAAAAASDNLNEPGPADPAEAL